MRNRVLLILTLGILFASCEDNMLLRSEKKLKQDLQGTWLRSFQGLPAYVDCDGEAPGSDPPIVISEYWTFKDNRLVTYYIYESIPICEVGTPDSTKADRNDTVVVSDFKIDAKVFKAFLKLQLISGAVDSSGNSQFVDKWEFVELSNDVLYLAADDPAGSGAVQREFSRVK